MISGIYSENTANKIGMSAENAFSNLCDERASGNLEATFWEGPANDDPISFFIIELDDFYTVSKIDLKNSHKAINDG